uniref:Nucleoporin NUP188 homolog n=1 Tax=Cacopsylla melanoneura TaxID=428564 RepID=A0A8D8LQF4_9HEMI
MTPTGGKFQTSISKDKWFLSWKQLYSDLSGGRGVIQPHIIQEKLSKYKSELFLGLDIFQPKAQESTSGWAIPSYDSATEEKKKKPNDSNLIIAKLSNILDLVEDTCEKIIISYFEFEFVGTADDVTKLLSSTNDQQEVLNDIILYHIHEKSFLVKCWKIILTCVLDKDNLYNNICDKFVRNQNSSTLYSFFVKQLEANQENVLPSEIHPHTEAFKTWINQRLNSQVDILSCLMYLLDLKSSVEFKDIQHILKLCTETSFGSNILTVQFAKATYPHEWKTNVEFMYCLHLVQLILDSNVDTDWTFAQFNELFATIKSLDHEKHPVVVPVISLAWILFLNQINYITDEDKLLNLFQQVFQLKPWQQLNTILDSEVVTVDDMFQDFIKKKTLSLVCESVKHFDLNVLEFENECLFKLISKFSSYDDHEEINKVISFGLDMFPGKQVSILNLYIPLMSQSKSNCKKVLEDLMSTRCFNWKSVDIPLESRDNAFYSRTSFCPFEFVEDIVIPAGTLCCQSESGSDYFQWDINILLWSIITEELSAYCMAVSDPDSCSEEDYSRTMSYLCNAYHGQVPYQKHLLPPSSVMLDSGLRYRVITYLRLIAALVKYPCLLDDNMTLILSTVSKLFELNTKCSHPVLSPDLEIVSLCIDIAGNMFPGVTLLYSQVTDILPTILPAPDVDNVYEILATGRFLDGNLLRKVLNHGDMTKDKFSLVMSYLQFLNTLSEQETCTSNPAYTHGMLYVVLEIFPSCLTGWLFEQESQRQRVCNFTLILINSFFNTYNPADHAPVTCTSAANLKPPCFTTIMRTVFHSILEGKCGQLLLEIASLGETFLLNAFQESPSSVSKLPKIIDIVYYTLAILNKILTLRKEMKDIKTHCLLEVSMDKPGFIQSVISLAHHSLRRHLRVLSIKLLTRIAQNKDISLCVSDDTARALWLQPLLSPTECPQFKIALLQFAVQCLQTQATLACSLLNVEQIETNHKPSLLAFVLNYLKSVNDGNDALYYWILAIVHSIWKQEMFIARSVFTKDPDFWSKLCASLHASPSCVNNPTVLSPVLNIISTELYWMSNDMQHPLFSFVDKFFSNDDNLKQWSNTCTSVAHCGEKFGLFHQLSISWQEFIIVVSKFRPSACTPRVKNILLSDVLHALLEHLGCMQNNADVKESFHALVNLGLILINSCEGQSLDDTETKLDIACQLIVLHADNFDSIPLKSQILFLALVSKLFTMVCKAHAPVVRAHTVFLNALSMILSRSLDIYETMLTECSRNTISKNTQLISVIMPLVIQVQTVLGKEHSFWVNKLLTENILYNVYQCVLQSINMKFYNDTSSFLIEYLIHCVLGHDYYKYLDKASLMLIIEEMSPDSHINVDNKNYAILKNHNISFIYTNEAYNAFYNQFINLLMVLLHRGDISMKRQVLNFIIINYESLICLLKYSGLALTKQNLNFVLSLLNLILEMSNYRILIQGHTVQYFIKIVQNICLCMNTTVDLIETEDLKIANKIYPAEAFSEDLHCKLYNSKLKTPSDRTVYCSELRIILLNIYNTCLSVYNKYNVEFGLMLTCARINYLPWAIQNIVPYVPIEKKLEPDISFCDFTIIMRCLKTHLKLLGTYKENERLANKVRSSFEMTVHLLINHSLMFLLNPYNNMTDKHVLLRDIEVNLAHVIDYIKKNNGVTILPFTKHWSKSPRKYATPNKLNMPHIKLKLKKENNVLTWGDDVKKPCVQRILFEDENKVDTDDDEGQYEMKADMEYMQFMVQLFSQVCALASNTM